MRLKQTSEVITPSLSTVIANLTEWTSSMIGERKSAVKTPKGSNSMITASTVVAAPAAAAAGVGEQSSVHKDARYSYTPGGGVGNNVSSHNNSIFGSQFGGGASATGTAGGNRNFSMTTHTESIYGGTGETAGYHSSSKPPMQQ